MISSHQEDATSRAQLRRRGGQWPGFVHPKSRWFEGPKHPKTTPEKTHQKDPKGPYAFHISPNIQENYAGIFVEYSYQLKINVPTPPKNVRNCQPSRGSSPCEVKVLKIMIADLWWFLVYECLAIMNYLYIYFYIYIFISIYLYIYNSIYIYTHCRCTITFT